MPKSCQKFGIPIRGILGIPTQFILQSLLLDEVVLLADNQKHLQTLADICGSEAADRGSTFSTEKLGVLVFSDKLTRVVSIQETVIPKVNEHKYQGVWINEEKTYLSAHKVHLKGTDN